MVNNSFSFPWILKASETVGAPISKCCLRGYLGQQFCPTIKSNKYLFIDNKLPGIVISSGNIEANKHCL